MYRGNRLFLEVTRKDKQNIGKYRSKSVVCVFENGGFAFHKDLTEAELIEIFRESRKGREGIYWLNANDPSNKTNGGNKKDEAQDDVFNAF